MRSLLFVPGDSQRKLDRSLESGADVLILDLEDSVSRSGKAKARETSAAFVAAHRETGRSKLYVRVNDLTSGMIGDDLSAIVPARPHGIMLPKACGASDVEHLSLRLRIQEAANGLKDGEIRILPIVTETAASVLATASFGPRLARLSAITWGAEDLSAAIGARSVRDDAGQLTDVFRMTRAMTILAAAAADVPAIDTVFVDYRDMESLRAECGFAERDGFTGKLAIHPDQVETINAAFTPSPEAIEEARTIVAAFTEAGNPGVLGIGGKMYDMPHLKRAQRLLTRAATA